MRERTRRRAKGQLRRAGAAFALLLAASGAGAQTLEDARRARNEGIVAGLRAESAEAAAIFERAEAAYDANDYAEAESLYGRVSELVPGLRAAKRRRALALSHAGRHAEATELARATARADEADENVVALALALAMNPASGKAELDDAAGYAFAAAERQPTDPSAQQALCVVALKAERPLDLEACSQSLMRQWPASHDGYTFGAIAAAARGEWGRARELLARAKAHGLPPEGYASLAQSFDDHEPFATKWAPRLLPALGLWLGALGLLVASGMALSRAALRAAGRVPREASGRAQGADAFLRGAYRAVLLASGAFYYASLPLVAAAVVGAAGALIFGLIALGFVPVKLVIILGAVAVFTLYAFAKGVLARASDGAPGVPLPLDEQPGLRAALAEVAGRVGTRPVDAVYLTPDASVAVFERGGLGRQFLGQTERCLVLGVGVLEGLGLAPFKAILAHEYGHFSNRDTAGGGFALAVRRSLLHSAVGLARGGVAGWYNPAWWFVSGFYRVFLRISHGASRLQEVLADRWAAFTYGPEAFAEGLAHVVRRSIAFDAHAEATLREVIDAKAPLANLYRHRPKGAPDASDLEARVREELEREPSPFDSHPSPAERIAWVRTLRAAAEPAEPGTAWGLFRDRDAIERILTEHVRQNVQRAHGVTIPAEAAPASAGAGGDDVAGDRDATGAERGAPADDAKEAKGAPAGATNEAPASEGGGGAPAARA